MLFLKGRNIKLNPIISILLEELLFYIPEISFAVFACYIIVTLCCIRYAPSLKFAEVCGIFMLSAIGVTIPIAFWKGFYILKEHQLIGIDTIVYDSYTVIKAKIILLGIERAGFIILVSSIVHLAVNCHTHKNIDE